MLPGRQDHGRQHGSDDYHDIPLSRRPLEDPIRTDANKPGQSAVWEIVSGTGRFEGLRGGGSMVARFESKDPDKGRETFTGTVGE